MPLQKNMENRESWSNKSTCRLDMVRYSFRSQFFLWSMENYDVLSESQKRKKRRVGDRQNKSFQLSQFLWKSKCPRRPLCYIDLSCQGWCLILLYILFYLRKNSKMTQRGAKTICKKKKEKKQLIDRDDSEVRVSERAIHDKFRNPLTKLKP